MQLINLYVLKRIFNKDYRGKGVKDVITRERFGMLTITAETMTALRTTVPVKRGGFGSPVTELSLRVLLALVGAVNVEDVGTELAYSVTNRKMVEEKLRHLADMVSQIKNEVPDELQFDPVPDLEG